MMMERFTALSHLDFYLPTKRDLLLFDQIQLVLLDEKLAGRAAHISLPATTMRDLEWLTERGAIQGAHIIASIATGRIGGVKRDELSRAFAQSYVAKSLEILSVDPQRRQQLLSPAFARQMIISSQYGPFIDADILMDEAFSRIIDVLTKDPTPQDLQMAAARAVDADRANIVRVYGANVRANGPIDVVPILPTIGAVAGSANAETAVINVVLPAVPEPDESVPWEAVLDFRNDPKTKDSLGRLRRWITRAALDPKDPRLLKLEIEDLLENYSAHMRLHKLKANKGVLETVVMLAADVLDALLHVRFSEAAKAVFAFQDRKIALLEAELSAPGREVAYIAHAAETFGQK